MVIRERESQPGAGWGLRAGLLALLVAFVALCAWAAADESVVTGLERMVAFPWGVVTLSDLGVGLVFAALWMIVVAGPRRAWPWILGLLVAGNASLLLFLVIRLGRRSPRELFMPDPRPSPASLSSQPPSSSSRDAP